VLGLKRTTGQTLNCTHHYASHEKLRECPQGSDMVNNIGDSSGPAVEVVDGDEEVRRQVACVRNERVSGLGSGQDLERGSNQRGSVSDY
jgi:hypothetical protein